MEDTAFLTKAFSGVHAVYTMVPPAYNVQDWKAHIGQVGKNYAEAIKNNHIKFIVNLSSIGAHMPEGCGPVSGLYRVEQALNALDDVNIKHLRPAYFYNNLLNNIGLVKTWGLLAAISVSATKNLRLLIPVILQLKPSMNY
ncbi:MAG: hypothetical protein NVSMB7_07490 [Chitinophagaceae bacterium]